jgi:hypothetical protein
MGGLVCMVHRQAMLEFQTIPTNPQDLKKFDAQIRRLYDWVAQDLVNDVPEQVKTVCDILAKPDFDMADRTLLLNVIESLYTPYT